MNETIVDGTSIELRRRVNAAPEAVFRAWTEPEALKSWYAPVEGWQVHRAEVDPRVGGGYRISFGPPGTDRVIDEAGTYEEFDPPHRLVVRVHLGGTGIEESTTVTVVFTSVEGGTEIVVREGAYSSRETAERHAGGWSTMLAQIAAHLGGQVRTPEAG